MDTPKIDRVKVIKIICTEGTEILNVIAFDRQTMSLSVLDIDCSERYESPSVWGIVKLDTLSARLKNYYFNYFDLNEKDT